MRKALCFLQQFFKIFFALGICSSALAQPNPMVYTTLNNKIQTVDILGPVNVEVKNSNVSPKTRFGTNKKNYNTVQMYVRHNTLFIARRTLPLLYETRAPQVTIESPSLMQLNVGRNSVVSGTNLQGCLSIRATGNARVNLSGNSLNLNDLWVNGPATVNITGVYSPSLRLYHKGAGKITLQGFTNLKRFDQIGTGQTVLGWVNSKRVIINLIGKNQLTICGQTCILEANLEDCATLDAKNLHALRGYIHTCGTSHAEVWTQDLLTAWAAGASNIYYYHDPQFVARYMCPPAVVLRMTDVCSCACTA